MRFEKASEVRKHLTAKGIDVSLVKVRKTHSPFSGATFFTVAPKSCDGPIVTMSDKTGTTFGGKPGSATVGLLVALREALAGTNGMEVAA